MANTKNLTWIYEAYQRAKANYKLLNSTNNPKRPTAHAQALQEAQRRIRSLEADALSYGKDQYIIKVIGKYIIPKGELNIPYDLEAYYPDGPEEFIKSLVEKDFPNCYSLFFNRIGLRINLRKL